MHDPCSVQVTSIISWIYYHDFSSWIIMFTLSAKIYPYLWTPHKHCQNVNWSHMSNPWYHQYVVFRRYTLILWSSHIVVKEMWQGDNKQTSICRNNPRWLWSSFCEQSHNDIKNTTDSGTFGVIRWFWRRNAVVCVAAGAWKFTSIEPFF